jgi:hypothetical protein
VFLRRSNRSCEGHDAARDRETDDEESDGESRAALTFVLAPVSPPAEEEARAAGPAIPGGDFRLIDGTTP